MYTIIVNGKEVETNGGRYNGRKIRQLAGVPDDHDLWIKCESHGDDCLFGDDDVITTHPTVSFYSAPREIND